MDSEYQFISAIIKEVLNFFSFQKKKNLGFNRIFWTQLYAISFQQ